MEDIVSCKVELLVSFVSMGAVGEIDYQSPTMGQSGSVVSSESEIFYGVHIPNVSDDHFLHVYTDKIEALKVVKHHKKARFKAFKQRSDAVNFAVNGSEYPVTSDDAAASTQPVVSATDAEKPSPFKGPRAQDLVQFRRAIENGNLNLVYKTVWDNPRYLVSSGDTPSILQEGSRYNALHVAAKSKNAPMADLILQTIGDPAFCGLLYGEESNDKLDTNVARAAVLLDLYLNTPDKGMHETPLHFASKFGAAQVVAILVSYVQCDRQRKNKFGQMPVDIICARCSAGNEGSKKEIFLLLENEYYVPVLRSEDNCVQPSVGVPFSPKNPPLLTEDPVSPRLEIHAFAGPMSKTQAEKFHRDLRIPRHSSSEFKNCLKKIKVRDPEKGLERSGRDLAAEYHVPWKEYWPFLGTFVDLASQEGLDTLETYLRQCYQSHMSKISDNVNLDNGDHVDNANESAEILKVNESCSYSDFEPEVLSPVTQLCSMMKACTIMDDSLGSGQGRGSPSALSSSASSNSSNGSILSSSSMHFFDWLSRGKPSAPKSVPSDNQNEAILAALSQPTLSPFLYVEKSLQVFAKRITTSLHHIVSGSATSHLTDAIRDVLKPEIKKVQGLVGSYMEDARFVAVDYHLVHSRVASSVAERLVAQLTSEEREIFYKNLQEMLSTRGHLDGTLSSDDEDYVPSTSTPYRQPRLPRQTGSSNQKAAIRCIISQMIWALDQLQGSGPDGRSPIPPRPQVRSESECLEMWSDAYSCSCTWFSQNQSNLSRHSWKQSSMKRSFHNSINVDGISRRLFTSEGEYTGMDEYKPSLIPEIIFDGEGERFFTPPSSPTHMSPVVGMHSDSDDDMTDPEEGPAVFIEGNEPTRVDVEVLNAISKCDITPSSHPCIFRWRHGVQLFSAEERKMWRTQTNSLLDVTPRTPHSVDVSFQNNHTEHSFNSSPLWSRITGAFSPRPSSLKSNHVSVTSSSPGL